ncbi:response regulator transcription factor [Glaciecola sp. XM2]|jgi:DNA-binding NarL/FixJ family response regulator|uniref:response regulator transcription factor n=1 Tax=Glaciecola sp. XM2 TaxID=1914931 RepID=UPI001BDE647A|nr:response regulator transcription factor [Glaciecola sp. XM2]MBT1449576.1 response regulator transcription factor [Glaciecola sp. XM2]
MIKILIADDHPLYREALLYALQMRLDKVKFLESDSLDSVLTAAKKNRNLNLILLDLSMPGCDDYFGLLKVIETCPDIPIAVISAYDSAENISQVMAFGAKAFIPKSTSTDELIDVIQKVLDGETWTPPEVTDALESVNDNIIEIAKQVAQLTPKQFNVLRLLREGMMNKQIAAQLNVTEATVKAHIGAILKQLDVKSRTQILLKTEKLQLN